MPRSIKKIHDMKTQARITRSSKHEPSSSFETQNDNKLTKQSETPELLVEIDRSCNSFKMLKHSDRGEIVVKPNSMRDSTLTPLNHIRKITKTTCSIEIKKQRKRGAKKSFWERKLTGACRISKRLKNLKLKKKELDKTGTQTGLYKHHNCVNEIETNCRRRKIKRIHQKISSARKSARGFTIHVKPNTSLPVSYSEPTKSLSTLSNDTSNMEIKIILTDINSDKTSMIVKDYTEQTETEEAKCANGDDTITMQCPDDSEIVQEITDDEESSHVEEYNQNMLGINVELEPGEDLICEEITFDSALQSGEGQKQIDSPSEDITVSSSEKVSEEKENMESFPALPSDESNECLPIIES